MLTIDEQLAQGRLTSPTTGLPLVMGDGELTTADGSERFPLRGGVPILLPNDAARNAYRAEADGAMAAEYARPRPPSRILAAIDRFVRGRGDFRGEGARRAFAAVVAERPAGELCLSIGGGPTRPHPNLCNLNLDLFPGVDLVADAYRLPYADDAVDAVHCEAVLEHLERPGAAVAEIFRVLAPGGEVFAATPFLQAFHAYPNHFQNFTLEGHDRLFARAGFEVVDSGPCVGPTFALTDLAALYARHFVPTRLLSRASQRAVALVGLLFRPLDRRLLRQPDAHVLASSVYAWLRKPPRGQGEER